jgi:hypothetical protein
MRNRRITFLAGIATLALVAGTGFVAAQDTSKEQKIPTQPHASAPAMKADKGAGAKMGQGTQSGKMGEAQGVAGESKGGQGQNAQKDKMGQTESTPKGGAKTGKDAERMSHSAAEKGADQNAKETDRHAREMNRGEKADKERFGEGKTNEGKMNEGRAAKDERNKEGASTTAEQRRNGGPNTVRSEDQRLHGLQGNASGVTLNDEQRTRIRNTVINARGAPRIGSIDFDLAVGTAIPRGRIEIVPVPETLVAIEPAWRGFRYFIYEDELVIVDPHDMRIVAVVPV